MKGTKVVPGPYHFSIFHHRYDDDEVSRLPPALVVALMAPREYLDAAYWHGRYESDEAESFDFYLSGKALVETLKSFFDDVKKKKKVLVAGVGRSALGAELEARGHSVVCFDRSVRVVHWARSRYAARNVRYDAQDARALTYAKATFDVIVDKALFDAMLCDIDGLKAVNDYLAEIRRVLRPNGLFLLVSHAKPKDRLPYFSLFQVQVETLNKPPINFDNDDDKQLYLYVCRPRRGKNA